MQVPRLQIGDRCRRGVARRRVARAARSQRDLHVDRRRRPRPLHAGPAERAARPARRRTQARQRGGGAEQGADVLVATGVAGAELRAARGGDARRGRWRSRASDPGRARRHRHDRAGADQRPRRGALHGRHRRELRADPEGRRGGGGRRSRLRRAHHAVHHGQRRRRTAAGDARLGRTDERVVPTTFPRRSRRACRSACSASRS